MNMPLHAAQPFWAELVGGGMSTDAYHMTAPDPEGGGATLVMKRALNDAGLKPEDIDYINVHGTSTGLGDIAEPKAIKKCLENTPTKSASVRPSR